MKIAVSTSFIALLGFMAVSPALAQSLVEEGAIAAGAAASTAAVAAQGKVVERQAKALAEEQAVFGADSTRAASSAAPPSIQPPRVESPKSGAAAPAPAVSPITAIVDHPPALDKGDKDDSADEALNKAPESVKTLVKRLNSDVDDITLNDLNEARQAQAKLEMLIEIEKRVSELEKIKKDREEKSLASAIPATAFGLRGGGGAGAIGGMNPPIMENGSAMPVPAPVVFQPSETEISGIIGANGIYVAQVKADDGQIRQARVGDKLPDGSIVQSISTHGVTALKNGKIRTLHVKDVGTIFGGQ